MPVLAVNVTEEDDIVKTIAFAKSKNLRLVIKSTGHDILKRSTGYGSLSIWLYNFRKGVEYHDSYSTVNTCATTNWTGSAFTIKGAYAWSDVYPLADEKGLILVGGNNKGPCSTGGWTQGGGHSGVGRYFGMGADQVLSARVVLASGEIVTASPCSHPDLFTALRGGGPGTYGVVTEMTFKAFPTQNVTVTYIEVGSPTHNTSTFLDVMEQFYSSYPYLSDIGFAGYGTWSIGAPAALFGNHTTAYTHSLTLLGSTEAQAVENFAPVLDKIVGFNGSEIFINITHKEYPDWGSYFNEKADTIAPVGNVGVSASRLIDGAALTGNSTLLRESLEVMAGAPEEQTYHSVGLHGGEIFAHADDPYSSLLPAWRKSYILDIVARRWTGDKAHDDEVAHDIRQVKVPAMQRLAPDTGSYMNEADYGNVDWKVDFYGANYERLSKIKERYDPDDTFYCLTCVGSEKWEEDADGSLCKV
ncbi:FAD-linked oxidoreductase apf9 [Lasiodiplodia theobromae]|uniref:FAD-linked oxidoreductase apf9 n=1 Tax=Lasiodiplodia theobromae TaxID=45133 RepID=A0A5N5DDJ1_9PEZI|nr:FAD-linked oxidoreductase apf9 [Lasiodiplodia theobromae]